MTVDEIRELIKLATETGIDELEVQQGENRVRIRRAGATQREIVLAHPAALAAAPASPPRAEAAPAAAAAPAKEPAAAPGSDPNLQLVRSPIVGTFYESSAPGSPPFVRVGERVQPGKVLCIIESMKLMNEIESEIAGTVIAKLMENGRPVEYGEALFSIRPR